MTKSQTTDQKISDIHEVVISNTQEIGNLGNRMDEVETKLDKVENRLDKVENRLDKVENHLEKVETKLDDLSDRFNTFDKKLDKIAEIVTVNTKQTAVRLSRLESKNSIFVQAG